MKSRLYSMSLTGARPPVEIIDDVQNRESDFQDAINEMLVCFRLAAASFIMIALALIVCLIWMVAK